MPHKHTIKNYVANSYYHVYNRGVNKQLIFKDDLDYRAFLNLLKYYLSDDDTGHPLNVSGYARPRPLVGLGGEISLTAYCLMPNHFHLLLKQKDKSGVTRLMRRVATTYAMHFNRKYDRVGYLFQGRFKAVLIQTEEALLYLTKYIHRNPVENMEHLTRTDLLKKLNNYKYSSYPYYLQKKAASWLSTDGVLVYFEPNKAGLLRVKHKNYKEFVEGSNAAGGRGLASLLID